MAGTVSSSTIYDADGAVLRAAGDRRGALGAVFASVGVMAAGAFVVAGAMRAPQPEAPVVAAAEPAPVALQAPQEARSTPPAVSANAADDAQDIETASAEAPDEAPPAKNAQDAAPADRDVAAATATADETPFVFGPPRVKPDQNAVAAISPPAATVATLSQPALAKAAPQAARQTLGPVVVALADEGFARPPIFPLSDVTPDRAPSPALAVALAEDLPIDAEHRTVRIAKGETFADALRRAGVAARDRHAAAVAVGRFVNLRRLRPDAQFDLRLAPPRQTLFQHASLGSGPENRLLTLTWRIEPEKELDLVRDGAGFVAQDRPVKIVTRRQTVRGRIDGSLFASARAAGAPVEIVGKLANVFAYDIDFQRDIFGGDEFEAVYEMRFDETGAVVGAGEILFGRLKWRGGSKEKEYFRFRNADGRFDYFDRAGQSAKRLLMKTPIDGARLSSGFGLRRHPILGYKKAHKGIDFAARRGTPVYAAGDGVVLRADRYGSFGNYVKIKHANGYETAYAHLNGFRKGVRKGTRVNQGDVIGYVGTTGRSTGPHLHYEVHLNGRAVNPQRLKMATGVKLEQADLAGFSVLRDEIDALRAPEGEAAQRLAGDATRASL
ncbi:MAG: peptidoglycan DD-metalloendopeptidase family protein [Pseudomonadota bacterium]